MNSRRKFIAGVVGAGAGVLVTTGAGVRSRQSLEHQGEFQERLRIAADTTSDTQPLLQQIMDAAPQEGSTVSLPSGRYRLDAELAVPAHVTLAIPRGAVLVGGSVSVLGSLDAGKYQVFENTRIDFGHGCGTWALPQWWGAKGDGETDDTDALQAAFDTRLVHLPAGRYRTTRELVIGNRTTIVGVGNSWSPTAATDSWIQYDGPEDASIAVLRASTAAVGVDPDSGLSNIHVERVVLNGGNRAGFGLYSVYCTDDSSFSDITVRHCTQHGIFISQQWYCSYRNLVARNNPGCGITIGRLFEGWVERGVNGVQLSNIRAAGNGSDRRFHEETNREWGYGVLFRPGGGALLQQIVSESNYGAGLIYDLGGSCSNRVEGGYLEGNGGAAHSEGAASRHWGMIVIGRSGARANSVSSLYLHGEVGNDRAQSIWLTGSSPNGHLTLRDLSFGQYLHADWERYRLEGFTYYGLTSYIIGSRPDDAGSME